MENDAWFQVICIVKIFCLFVVYINLFIVSFYLCLLLSVLFSLNLTLKVI